MGQVGLSLIILSSTGHSLFVGVGIPMPNGVFPPQARASSFRFIVMVFILFSLLKLVRYYLQELYCSLHLYIRMGKGGVRLRIILLFV